MTQQLPPGMNVQHVSIPWSEKKDFPDVVEVTTTVNIAKQNWLLSISQITSELMFIDCGRMYQITSEEEGGLKPKYIFKVPCPVRCSCQAKNLFVCCLDNGAILCYDMDSEFKLVQSYTDKKIQARSMDYWNGLLVIGYFGDFFETYFVHEEGISLMQKYPFDNFQSLRFLEDHRNLAVASYGKGIQHFFVKNMEIKTKYNYNLFDDTKINHMVRLGKQKWLLLDWDKRRYIVWDRKRNSYKVIKAEGDQGKLICGEKMGVKHPFGMLNKDITREIMTFPLTLIKSESGLSVLNYKNNCQQEVSPHGTVGLLNQKLFKIWKTEDEVTDIRNMEFFTTNIDREIYGQLLKIKINTDKLLAIF
eukprot:403346719